MRLTRIYTKVGDKGSTMLANGELVPKDSLRIDTYGTIDELNAFLGLWRDVLSESNAVVFQDLIEKITKIQNEMHDLGGELATPFASLDITKQQIISAGSIERLEKDIDHFNLLLPPLTNFVLPGGHKANSLAHVCRTICRRAERLLCALARVEEVRSEPRIYLNRLSDWLFVAGRETSRRLGCPEIIWEQKAKNL